MCKLIANITPFYKRNLSIHGFWYPQRVLEQTAHRSLPNAHNEAQSWELMPGLPHGARN